MNLHKNSFVLLLLVPPFIITGIALLLILIPLPAPLPEPGSHARNLPAAILTGVMGLTWVCALCIFVVYSFQSAGLKLEASLTSKGLKASYFPVFGRQYQGILDERKVDIQFIPGRMVQNSLLNIQIQITNIQLMAIGLNKPLLDGNNYEMVNTSPFNLGNLKVYVKDLKWAQDFLRETSHSEMINRLIDNSDELGYRELYFQPGRIWLHARPNQNFNPTHFEVWLQALLDLSSAIEKTN